MIENNGLNTTTNIWEQGCKLDLVVTHIIIVVYACRIASTDCHKTQFYIPTLTSCTVICKNFFYAIPLSQYTEDYTNCLAFYIWLMTMHAVLLVVKYITICNYIIFILKHGLASRDLATYSPVSSPAWSLWVCAVMMVRH